jgi:hypothetical protein
VTLNSHPASAPGVAGWRLFHQHQEDGLNDVPPGLVAAHLPQLQLRPSSNTCG